MDANAKINAAWRVPRAGRRSVTQRSRIEPGLVLLCLLELRAMTSPTVTLVCSIDDVPRRLRPHARVDGGRVLIPRLAALEWVEYIAQRVGAGMSRAHAQSTGPIVHQREEVEA